MLGCSTPVFRKGDNLYGLSHSGEAVRKAGFAVLVEGYIDFLSLYQAGFRNLVATLGTGFTPGHAKLLGRFTRRIVVNFDPDTAGTNATERTLGLLVGEDFNIKVLRLEAGFDPDLFIRTAGEMRVSNFLIWQGAYAEYYCTPVFWPDFDRRELLSAFEAYDQRERKFAPRIQCRLDRTSGDSLREVTKREKVEDKVNRDCIHADPNKRHAPPAALPDFDDLIEKSKDQTRITSRHQHVG